MALVAVCALACSGFVFRRDIATWYVARQLRFASTPALELTACERMNDWSCVWTYPYGVIAEDASGNRLKPWRTGQYDRVALVVITWENGTTVRRKLMNHSSLKYIFGE